MNIRKVISETMKRPGYLAYFWANVDVIRDHFPKLHRWMSDRRRLYLGENRELAGLHVILRTTDEVMNLNSSRGLECAGIVTRNDVNRVGGCSLFPAAKRFMEDYPEKCLRVTLVVDRLSDAGLKQYHDVAESCGITIDVINARESGNGPTFQSQIDVALSDSDEMLELILEDDYRLAEDSFSTAFAVMSRCSKVVGLVPHFHPDRVRFQDVTKTTVLNKKLYCRVPSTCCTFFITAGMIRKYLKFLRIYDGWEKGSIGKIWSREICLAPFGWTLAEHLHRSDLSPVQTLLTEEV